MPENMLQWPAALKHRATKPSLARTLLRNADKMAKKWLAHFTQA